MFLFYFILFYFWYPALVFEKIILFREDQASFSTALWNPDSVGIIIIKKSDNHPTLVL